MKHFTKNIVLILILGCGSTPTGNKNKEPVSEDTKDELGTWGDPCESDGDCATGQCLENDYAPFKWCSRACDEDKEPCKPDANGNVGGWCTQMPDEFDATIKRLCLPVCKDVYECEAKSSQWTTCATPSYKGNQLHTDLPAPRVCSTPAVHGQDKIDPATCSGWKDTKQAKSFPSQVSICEGYCDYLVKCKEVKYTLLDENEMRCCAYGCLLKTITPEGKVDDIYDKKVKCYNNYFASNIRNPNACTAHEKDSPGPGSCEKPPEDTRPTD